MITANQVKESLYVLIGAAKASYSTERILRALVEESADTALRTAARGMISEKINDTVSAVGATRYRVEVVGQGDPEEIEAAVRHRAVWQAIGAGLSLLFEDDEAERPRREGDFRGYVDNIAPVYPRLASALALVLGSQSSARGD